MANAMKDCTFHPKTNEAEKRQLLQYILESGDAGSCASEGLSG